jgi:hypothetical protein
MAHLEHFINNSKNCSKQHIKLVSPMLSSKRNWMCCSVLFPLIRSQTYNAERNRTSSLLINYKISKSVEGMTDLFSSVDDLQKGPVGVLCCRVLLASAKSGGRGLSVRGIAKVELAPAGQSQSTYKY